MSDKTEEATPKRLRQAREDGDAGVSAQSGREVGFFAGTLVLATLLESLVPRFAGLVRAAMAAAREPERALAVDGAGLALGVVTLTVPLVAVVAGTSAVVLAVQTGGVFSPKALAPKLERLDVVRGLGGLVSPPRLGSVVRSLALSALVLWLGSRALRHAARDLVAATGDPGRAARIAGPAVLGLVKTTAALGLAFALADVLLTRASWKKRLRMSKDEVKREHKESDGDPEIKAARERAHHEVMTQATLARVRTASVVVVNPTHLACALRYEARGDDEAPVVVAQGEGGLALRMIAEARAAGVPVVRDVPLAHALVALAEDEPIPELLYEAVAAVLEEAFADDARAADERPDEGRVAR